MSEKKKTKKLGSVSSQSEFYSDLSVNGMWYAKIVRAPAKSGSITSITTPDLPDEYYFFTARNVPGKNIIDSPSGKIPLFCEGSISYLGEPVGILTGPDEKQVNEYARDVVATRACTVVCSIPTSGISVHQDRAIHRDVQVGTLVVQKIEDIFGVGGLLLIIARVFVEVFAFGYKILQTVIVQSPPGIPDFMFYIAHDIFLSRILFSFCCKE